MCDHHISREMQKAALIMARAAELNARVAGMIAENQQRIADGRAIAYPEKAFNDAILETGCYWNSVGELLNGY